MSSAEHYKILYKEVWSLKDECLEYLKKDLMSLFQVLLKVNKIFHSLWHIQMTESLTISGMAMRLFFKDFYKIKNSTFNR